MQFGSKAAARREAKHLQYPEVQRLKPKNSQDPYFDDYDDLTKAAMFGNKEVVKSLLKDPNLLKKHKKLIQTNFIMVAAFYNQTAILQLLVDLEVPIDTVTDEPPTLIALRYIPNPQEKFRIFKMFLDQGADPNVKLSTGDTLLSLCVENKFYAEAAELLKNKADLYAVDNLGVQPIERAYAKENYRMLALLIEHGYDITKEYTRSVGNNLFACDFIDFVIIYDKLANHRRPNFQKMEQFSELRGLAQQISSRIEDKAAYTTLTNVILGCGMGLGGAIIYSKWPKNAKKNAEEKPEKAPGNIKKNVVREYKP